MYKQPKCTYDNSDKDSDKDIIGNLLKELQISKEENAKQKVEIKDHIRRIAELEKALQWYKSVR